MKKFFSILTAVILVFLLSACNMSEKENKSNAESSSFSSVLDDDVFDKDDFMEWIQQKYTGAEIIEFTENEDVSMFAKIKANGSTLEITYSYYDKGLSISDFGILEQNYPTYEEVQAKYPNKTVLVWAIMETGGDGHAPFHSAELNEYLDEQGYEFAVCFKPIDESTEEMFPDEMLTGVKKLLDNGERIDIISPMNYDEFVFESLYEPLDDYLETEIGRGLYNAFPEKFWASQRINGGIYGLCGTMTPVFNPDRGYYVNAELAEKYGYDITKPILEQLDILKAVKENEKNADVFSADLYIDNISAFVNVKMLSAAVYWNNDTHSAELSIDDPRYIEWLRLYDTMKKENLLNALDGGKHKESFFIMSDAVCGGGLAYADMKPIDVDYFGNTVTAIPVFTPYSALRTVPVATGICSKSEHKEKAFELLARIYTDPVLNNLLVYGIEGENYTLENGFVKEIENPSDNMFNINPFNTYRFANQMICHRSAYNLFTPEQYTGILENAEVYADIDFTLDPTNLISELNAEYIAADTIVLPKENENLDDILAEYRESLYAAGVQKIIDECNRQYEVYKNEKNS
ncbi:MAG: hypothetical protein HDT43_01090 [Ruminococcaceae bacterium]|nr:hypothetical protein [Oscillospiraceae bacterium]